MRTTFWVPSFVVFSESLLFCSRYNKEEQSFCSLLDVVRVIVPMVNGTIPHLTTYLWYIHTVPQFRLTADI